MENLKADSRSLPEFYLNDRFGNKISIKYYYDKKNPVKGLFNRKYKQLLLKVNYQNKPKQKQCTLNSSQNLIYERRFSERVNSFIAPINSTSEDIKYYHHLTSGYLFEIIDQNNLVDIDMNLVDGILNKYFKENEEFRTDRFMAYYELYTTNIYEVINEIYLDAITEELKKSGHSFLSEILINSNINSYELLEIILEIEARNSSSKLIKKLHEVTAYSLHAMNNLNIQSSPLLYKTDHFHVSNNYLKNVGFCVPIPDSSICKSDYHTITFPSSDLATQYYYPYYLWESNFPNILGLKKSTSIKNLLERFNCELKSHLSSTSKIAQYID